MNDYAAGVGGRGASRRRLAGVAVAIVLALGLGGWLGAKFAHRLVSDGAAPTPEAAPAAAALMPPVAGH